MEPFSDVVPQPAAVDGCPAAHAAASAVRGTVTGATGTSRVNSRTARSCIRVWPSYRLSIW